MLSLPEIVNYVSPDDLGKSPENLDDNHKVFCVPWNMSKIMFAIEEMTYTLRYLPATFKHEPNWGPHIFALNSMLEDAKHIQFINLRQQILHTYLAPAKQVLHNLTGDHSED